MTLRTIFEHMIELFRGLMMLKTRKRSRHFLQEKKNKYWIFGSCNANSEFKISFLKTV
jgi:hypothetical protein